MPLDCLAHKLRRYVDPLPEAEEEVVALAVKAGLKESVVRGIARACKKATAPRPPCPPPPEPVGDYLSSTLEWLGQVKTGGCGCKKLQNRMNRLGVKGCREEYEMILTKLHKEALDRDIPLPRTAFIPLLEFAIWRASRHKPVQ